MAVSYPAPEIRLQIAEQLLAIGAVNMRPQQPFTLTSGKPSPVYVDCRKIISFPSLRRTLIAAWADYINATPALPNITSVAGGETAGIPYAAWLAEALNLPMLYVRKKPKGFGRNAQIEGVTTPGDHVLLIEDMATDGGSKVVFVDALRAAECVVTHCLVVFYYDIFDFSRSPLAACNVNLFALATWQDILNVARQQSLLDQAALSEIEGFLHAPATWQKAWSEKTDT